MPRTPTNYRVRGGIDLGDSVGRSGKYTVFAIFVWSTKLRIVYFDRFTTGETLHVNARMITFGQEQT